MCVPVIDKIIILLLKQERVEYNSNTAELLTNGTWEYKPPMAQDIPSVMNLTLLKNAKNASGILGSKATGEPPMIAAR